MAASEREGAIHMESVRFPVFVRAVVAAVFLLAPLAYADQITVFELTVGPSDTPSGTVTIDTTTGIVEAIDFSFPGSPIVSASGLLVTTFWDAYGTAPNAFVQIQEEWATPTYDSQWWVGINLPVSSLVGYPGGNICSTTDVCYEGATSGVFVGDLLEPYYFASGQLEPVVAEPASFILLGTGALVLVGVFRRKLFQRVA